MGSSPHPKVSEGGYIACRNATLESKIQKRTVDGESFAKANFAGVAFLGAQRHGGSSACSVLSSHHLFVLLRRLRPTL